MIEIPTRSDIENIATLIEAAVFVCIDAADIDRRKIVEKSLTASRECIEGIETGAHLIHRSPDGITGLVLVKDYWNMVNLFVLPISQRKGIATTLLNRAFEICREHSTSQTVSLNSSNFASEFYENYGFERNGRSRDLPGGCVPYTFQL
jgi:GNAT superfamily N-acetyltransferase